MKAAEVLQFLSDKCRLKHLSYATEKSYWGWAQSYIRALGKYPKGWSSEEKAEAYLTTDFTDGTDERIPFRKPSVPSVPSVVIRFTP